MDKGTYEAMKRDNRYGLDLFYNYYLENFHLTGKPESAKITQEVFAQAFPQWLAMGFTTADALIVRCTGYYDKKFGL